MIKPTVYIVVEDGLVQEVYVEAPWGANTEVVLCDKDTTDLAEKAAVESMVDWLPDVAHKVY